jgi:hypothetical protein
VDYFDIVDQAVSIIQDPRLQDGFMTDTDIRNENGFRVYGEMNTGHCWEQAQKEAPKVHQFLLQILFQFLLQNVMKFSQNFVDTQGATVVPIIGYLDGTWLSKGGGHSATPMSMTIGNLPRHVMNKSIAKRVRWLLFYYFFVHIIYYIF